MSLTLKTSHGDIKVELFCEKCPKACANFLALAAMGKYDGTAFHWNIKGFIIQGGDTSGTGTGGDSVFGHPFENEISEDLKHNGRGMLSMANKGEGTNGSQFFFTYSKQESLDGKYSLFGKVIGGFETLDAFELEPVTGKQYKPANSLSLESINIHSNPFADNEALNKIAFNSLT